MNIFIMAVGKIKETFFKEGITEYSKRLKNYCKLEIFEVEDERLVEPVSEGTKAQVKLKEANRITEKIKILCPENRGKTVVVALDVSGKKVTSEGLANLLVKYMTDGKSSIIFVIGGSIGFDEAFLEKVDFRLSMSDLTFPHQMARLMLTEQIYRAFKIINNETYHK